MKRSFLRRLASMLLVAAAFPAAGAFASTFSTGPSAGYVPRVPISALARPITALDLSRFQVSSMVSVGSGWGGGTNALQVTSLTYNFQAPVVMRVSIGNAWGPQVHGNSAFFLEGVDLSFRPTAGTFLQFSYQDRRSPLQYGPSPLYFGPGWDR